MSRLPIDAFSSIGLGGSSIVRKDSPTSKLTIGHHIKTRAHVFGGDVSTATDYAVVCAKVSGHSLDDASRRASRRRSTTTRRNTARS